jgi:menaquinone-dependent protoporphyrinogen IX oxidase
MSAQRILIVYGTHHGQTAKIAQRMADVLTTAGNSVTLAKKPNARPPRGDRLERCAAVRRNVRDDARIMRGV